MLSQQKHTLAPQVALSVSLYAQSSSSSMTTPSKRTMPLKDRSNHSADHRPSSNSPLKTAPHPPTTPTFSADWQQLRAFPLLESCDYIVANGSSFYCRLCKYHHTQSADHLSSPTHSQLYQLLADSHIVRLADRRFQCELCGTKPLSMGYSLTHVEGSKHVGRINKLQLQQVETSSTVAVDDPHVERTVQGGVICTLCQTKSMTPAVLSAHLQGHKHCLNLAKLEQEKQLFVVDTSMDSNVLVGETIIRVSPRGRAEIPVWRCTLCSTGKMPKACLDVHLAGKRHLTAVAKAKQVATCEMNTVPKETVEQKEDGVAEPLHEILSEEAAPELVTLQVEPSLITPTCVDAEDVLEDKSDVSVFSSSSSEDADDEMSLNDDDAPVMGIQAWPTRTTTMDDNEYENMVLEGLMTGLFSFHASPTSSPNEVGLSLEDELTILNLSPTKLANLSTIIEESSMIEEIMESILVEDNDDESPSMSSATEEESDWEPVIPDDGVRNVQVEFELPVVEEKVPADPEETEHRHDVLACIEALAFFGL